MRAQSRRGLAAAAGGHPSASAFFLTTRQDRQRKHELKSWPGTGLEVPSARSEPRARWQAPQDILRTKHAAGSLPRWACARQGDAAVECAAPAPQARLWRSLGEP